MNANELADKLSKEWVLHDKNVGLLMKTSAEFLYTQITMLRQQQADKELWQDQYLRLNEITEQWKNSCFKQQAEIEALKTYKPNQTLECSFDLAGLKPPAKTLTDDEMELAYYECFDLKNKMPDNEKRRSYFKFARAILRKAQEK